MTTTRTVTFPMTGFDLTHAGLYNHSFNTLEELQNFYWNATQMQAEELEEIFWDDKINVVHLVNFPHFFTINCPVS